MNPEDLKKLIDDDDLGLLKVKPKAQQQCTADERLIASFEEINKFIDDNGREPKPSMANIIEYQLHSRLNAIRADKEKIKALLCLDKHGLLKTEIKEIKSIEDIFADDDFGLLSSEADSIFTLKHVPKETNMPDYIARRKACEDFDKFEHLFIQCQEDLRQGKRTLSPFQNEQNIDKGLFFVLKGVLLYVAEVGEREIINDKVNARLRCIFENGTESDMLLRSLAAELYKDGRRVSKHFDHLLEGFSNVSAEDEETGFIYILKSLSKDPNIQSIENLFKIGFSKVPVEERIKNAEQEPTYLMAPVQIVSAFKCFNFNPQKLEQLLHQFFGTACLNIDIFDNQGKRHMPREWFVAPLDVIQEAIQLLLSGEIVNYYFESEKQEIVEKCNK